MLHFIAESQTLSSPQTLHFYSSSGGNAGLACVTAAAELGYKSTVVVPTSTELSMVLRLQAAGASDVVVHGASWQYADQYLRETVIPQAEARGETGIYVPPFDHPVIWDGASTMVHEIQRQMPDGKQPDAIICSVGGGGLFAGVMRGVDQAGWSDKTQVLAVETVGADSLHQSLQQKQLVTLPAITSIAKSLGAVRVAEHVFKTAQRANVTSLVLEDAEAAMGSWRFADDERMLVEPACGASIALAYDGRLRQYLSTFGPETSVVIVVCGGSRVDLQTLQSWKMDYQQRADELAAGYESKRVPSSVTA